MPWPRWPLSGAIATSLTRADITVATTFLDSPGGNPAGLVDRGDVVVLAISALNDTANVKGGSIGEPLPAGMVIAAVPDLQPTGGCGRPTSTPALGDTTFSYATNQVRASTGGVTGRCIPYGSVQVIGRTGTGPGSVATLNKMIAAGAYQGTPNGGPVTD